MSPLLAIRFAMMLGVLLFGGVVYFARASQAAPEVSPDRARQLVLIGRVLWTVAIAAALFAQQAFRRASARENPQAWSIIGWAIGEATALFGAVVWFLTGNPAWYLPGLLFLAITFLVFPAQRE